MVQCLGCGAQNKASVSKCERCGGGLSSICAHCGAGNPALARFCNGCGERLEPASDSISWASREKPERRQMTVLFCDLVGSTRLARTMDPEDWHLLVNEVHSQLGGLIAKYHGHVAQYLGDGLLAYFGYPAAAQDDARRAVTAALAMVPQAAEIGAAARQDIRIRVGIHTGPVVIGTIGAASHQESLAVGDTPNLAARIQDMAPPNGVVVSRETHHLTRAFFVSKVLGDAVVLKGFSEPVALHLIVRESGVRTRLEAASVGGLTPLVGREAESTSLLDAWDSALAGRNPTVFLRGDAGIGKSRLIHVLKESLAAQGASFLELRCSEHGLHSAFHPFVEGLQWSGGLRHGDPPEQIASTMARLLKPAGLSDGQIALIAHLFGVPIPPAYAPPTLALHPALVEALSAWIVGSGERGPTLFVVEDVHWADPSTLEVLASLAKRPPAGNVLTILTARPEVEMDWAVGERVKTLVLGRLDPADTRRLITMVAGGKVLPAPLVERLAARADGIPLFLEEMTKSILESGILRETETGFELDEPMRDSSIPTTLHDSLMARLDQLGVNKSIVQVASVLGREFSLHQLEAVWRRLESLPAIDLAEGLDRVAQAELITRNGGAESTYQFRHSLLQEAAYQSLLRSARREYHLESARTLRDDFAAQAELQPEIVARHFTAAQASEEAADYWIKAGNRSVASSSHAEAIGHYLAALDQLSAVAPSPQRSKRELDVRVSLGVVLIATRGYAAREVEETYSRAAELCEELGTELPLRVIYGVWAVHLVRGDWARIVSMVPTFEALAQDPPNPVAALVAHSGLGTLAFWRGEYSKLATHHAAASLLYDAHHPELQPHSLMADHSFDGILNAHLYFAWSQALTGDVESALQTWQTAAALGDELGEPYLVAEVLAFGAALNHDIGELQRAGELADRAAKISAEKGFIFWLAIATIVSGRAAVARGDAEAGLRKITEGLAIFGAVGVKTPRSYYLCYLAEAYLATQRPAEAVQTLNEALGMSRSNVDCNFEPEILRLLGEAQLVEGDVVAARDTLLQAIHLARAQGARLLELRAATALARATSTQGQADEARRLLQDARSAFGQSVNLAPLRSADELLIAP
jgi:class 3 adenylate cyclase/tetratricopeptide (TPR) repeat protein